MKLRGHVVKKLVYQGTKSEHEGIIISSAKGEWKLRRRGGNAFRDEILEGLEGKEIEGDGIIRGGQFILDQWIIID